MEYRASPTSPAQTLTWDDFHAMIRRGEVAPSSLVRAHVITGGDWWTADNLAVFHRESPVKYPHGPHLAAELERRREEAERRARIGAALSPYYDALQQPWMLEDIYGITPLEAVVVQPDVIGASRLVISASFAPEYVVTCAFTPAEVQVEVVTGSVPAQTALWHQWFRPELVADVDYAPPPSPSALEIRRAAMRLPLDRAPEPFRSWEVFVALTRAAPSCHSQTLDGVDFSHELRGGGVRLTAGWSNPRQDTDPRQRELVAAYREVLGATGLVRHRRVL